jgi:hypothetical protein
MNENRLIEKYMFLININKNNVKFIFLNPDRLDMKYEDLVHTELIYNDNGLILVYNISNESMAIHHNRLYNDGVTYADFYSTGRKGAYSGIQIEKGALNSAITECYSKTGESGACPGSKPVKGEPSLYRTYHHKRNEYGKAGGHHRNNKKEKVIFAG